MILTGQILLHTSVLLYTSANTLNKATISIVAGDTSDCNLEEESELMPPPVRYQNIDFESASDSPPRHVTVTIVASPRKETDAADLGNPAPIFLDPDVTGCVYNNNFVNIV